MPLPRAVDVLVEQGIVKKPSVQLITYIGCATCHLARQGTVDRTQIANCTGLEINTVGLGLKRLEEAGVLATVSKPSQPGTPHTYAIAPTQPGEAFQNVASLRPDCPLLPPPSEELPPSLPPQFHDPATLMAHGTWV